MLEPTSSFAEWSKTAGTKSFVWPDPAPRPLGIITRVMPTIYPWRPLNIEVGEPHASITLNRPIIRFPEPFDQHGLTNACRDFIIEAVHHAVEKDGRQRSITWPEAPSHHHGEAA